MAENSPPKKTLRAAFLNIRESLSGKAMNFKSQKICMELGAFLETQKFDTVFGYAAFRNEPDLLMFYKEHQEKLRFALPLIFQKGHMEFREYFPGEELIKGAYGLLEPSNDSHHKVLLPTEHTLILVPALAIDGSGVRLGYGGGYYDRYLADKKKGLTIGIIVSECYTDSLPSCDHDMRVALIGTEMGIINGSIKRSEINI